MFPVMKDSLFEMKLSILDETQMPCILCIQRIVGNKTKAIIQMMTVEI